MNLDFSVDNAHIHEETWVAKNIQLCHNRLLASPFLLSLATSMKHGVYSSYFGDTLIDIRQPSVSGNSSMGSKQTSEERETDKCI